MATIQRIDLRGHEGRFEIQNGRKRSRINGISAFFKKAARRSGRLDRDNSRLQDSSNISVRSAAPFIVSQILQPAFFQLLIKNLHCLYTVLPSSELSPLPSCF